ncbi:DUF134 domain-containing protein [Candidatus Microgenomates bacterium]|jgi:predicted DNA-binding protein (UPF0251 family)|nr:MAG: DUF134 domain-containing protein [Candidatus Microgenomates bacterium]
MPRPRVKRLIRFKPDVYYFKPQGIPLRLLDEVVLQPDELEALRLYDVEENEQTKAAGMMKISQPTFARLIDSAHSKVAKAIVNGMAIRIEESS